MATKKSVFTVYFDISKVQKSIEVPGSTFEEALEAARKMSTIGVLTNGEYADYEKAEVSGVYKTT